MRLDLRELELRVVRIHRHELLARWGSQDLDDLNELVHPAFAREQGLTQNHLCHYASHRPDVDAAGVVRRAKDKLGCAIVTRADVRNVALPRDELLCTSEIAKLQHMRLPINQEVLRLDVAMTNPKRMEV